MRCGLIFTLLMTLASLTFANRVCEDTKIDMAVNVSFTYELKGAKSYHLPGVKKDRTVIKKINKDLYGNDVRQTDITDSFLKDVSDKSSKELFLNKLRKIAQKSNNENLSFSYSGHGWRCRKPGEDITWCIELPNIENNFKTFLDGQAKIPVADLSDSVAEQRFVTIEEIFDAFPAKMGIFDSCFAGQLVLKVNKMESLRDRGIFVVASTTGETLAYEDKGGGRLISSLQRMLEAKDDKICRLDFDGDGVISQREAFSSVFSSHVNRSLGFMRDWFKDKGKAEFNTGTQLPLANPSNSCFLNLNGRCNNSSQLPELNSCVFKKVKAKKLVDSLTNTFSNIDKNDPYSFLYKSSDENTNTDKWTHIGTENSTENKASMDKSEKDKVDARRITQRQKEHLEQIYIDWMEEVFSDVSSECGSDGHCVNHLKTSFGNVLDLIERSIKPLFQEMDD